MKTYNVPGCIKLHSSSSQMNGLLFQCVVSILWM